MTNSSDVPASILVVGSGVFGLSTAYALSQHPAYLTSSITVLDRCEFPNPDGSSIDSSRIVRADYADVAYARLALSAQEKWRSEWWGKDVYHEDGLVIAVMNGETSADDACTNTTGREYMRESLDNVRRLGLKDGPGLDVEVLPDRRSVAALFAHVDADSASEFDADYGYINRRSGWVDATGAMTALRRKVEATRRVTFLHGTAEQLVVSSSDACAQPSCVTGVRLTTGAIISAEQTILATGAWTPALLDLRRTASATGQAVAYINLTDEEQALYGRNPTILNESTGLFVITPSSKLLKIARHGYGYANPTRAPSCLSPTTTSSGITVSLPPSGTSHTSLPAEATTAIRCFLRKTYPALASREFSSERICWYTDTPRGDWIVMHHPTLKGLFVATGGSGHAFKFAPVLGDAVVRRLRGEEVGWGLDEKWDWPTLADAGREHDSEVAAGGQRDFDDATLDGDWRKGQVWTEDWRGGRKWMVLEDELRAGA